MGLVNAISYNRDEYSSKKANIFRVSITKFIILFIILGIISWEITGASRDQGINIYVTLIWSLNVPLAIVCFLGILNSKRKNIQPSIFKDKIDEKVIIVIPSIARLDVLPALYRVIDSVKSYAPSNLNNFRIDVVVDEGSDGISLLKEQYGSDLDIQILVVPEDYRLPNGTKYKARAAAYALSIRSEQGDNTKEQWIYHLDDDTSIRGDTISAIAEFIRNKGDKLYLAQGVLTFPYERSRSHISKFADSIRPIDDISKFFIFTGRGNPKMGLHGEHLLIRADIEEEIGWDFGKSVKVEDAYFAMFFSIKYPEKSGFLNGATYGSSPSSVKDLLKQRRRWASGLISLMLDNSIALKNKWILSYAVIIWMIGFIQNVWIVILVAILLGENTAPMSKWIILLWTFNIAYQMWSYMEGSKINLYVSDNKNYVHIIFMTIISIPGIFFISLVESFASLLGLIEFLKRKEGFDVISKKV